MTPSEAFSGRKPTLAKLHFFSSVCFAYVEHKKNIDARSQKCIFMGYDKESPAYLAFFFEENLVRSVRCVKFRQDED